MVLRRLAEGLPVEWLGSLDETVEFLRDLDLFVLVAEPPGCPNASLEAMACGLPVIATDVGGMREQVVDGVTGRLVGRTMSTASPRPSSKPPAIPWPGPPGARPDAAGPMSTSASIA